MLRLAALARPPCGQLSDVYTFVPMIFSTIVEETRGWGGEGWRLRAGEALVSSASFPALIPVSELKGVVALDQHNAASLKDGRMLSLCKWEKWLIILINIIFFFKPSITVGL